MPLCTFATLGNALVILLSLIILTSSALLTFTSSPLSYNSGSLSTLCSFLTTTALALPIAITYAPPSTLKFLLSHLCFTSAFAVGSSIASSLTILEIPSFPSYTIEVFGGGVFTLSTLSLVLLSVPVADGGEKDIQRGTDENEAESMTDLSSPLLPNGTNEEESNGTNGEDTEPRIKNPTTRLLSLAIPHRNYLFLGCFALLLRLPFSLSIPHFVAETIGCLNDDDYDGASENIVLLTVCGTIDACLDFWCVYLFGLCQLNLVKTVRTTLFSRLLKMEVSFFDSTTVGSLTSRLNSDTSAMSGDLTWFFRFSIEATIRITGIAAYMFIRSPTLGLAACTIIPIVALVNKKYGDWLSKNSKEVQTALAEANEAAQETLSCARTVISFANEGKETERYNDRIQKHYLLNVKQTIAQGLYYMVVSTFLVNTCVQAALLYVGSRLVKEDSMKVEVLVAFMLYQGQLQEYTLQIFQSYTALRQSSGAGDKVFEMMDRKINPPGVGSTAISPIPSPSPSIPSTQPARVSLDNVSFTYPSRPNEPVLRNLSLDIAPGTMVALVGKSGCGKSTICSLIERFYDPTSGSITFNGANLKDLDVQTLRSDIGIVSQEPVLFSGTIFDNICYGFKREIDELDDGELKQRVEEAAKTAGAHSFITSFEKGYETVCGERGVSLSGGQKQRIAIARAIVKKPALLLFDEATAALDNESERVVQEALERACGLATTLVVAHRLKTVRKADKIVVIEDGNVIESGSHDELVRRGEKYAEMLRMGN
mmetsp:Transcript_16181/g.33182  ORF Transcript_16181/g.33182 Transcript_16181/m.33182 type:complete len:768 (-) Transcript_16181:32-2335(-)